MAKDSKLNAEFADETRKKHSGAPLWKAGQSGNPAGRPKGARSKFGEAFLNDFLNDWESNGPQVIAKVREERPQDYLRVAASILPKELNVKVSDLDDLSDAEIDRRIATLASALRLEIGTGETAARAEASSGSDTIN